MAHNDKIGVRGFIRVEAVNEATGEAVVLADWSNTVTYDLLSNVVALLSQTTGDLPAAERAIHYISFESSVTPLPEADVSDIGPGGTEVAAIVIDRTTGVTLDVAGVPGIVEYRAELGKAEANGSTLRAVGLYTRGDNDVPASSTSARLVARQLISPMEKSNAYKITVAWRLQINKA